MFKKFTVLFLLAASSMIFLPSQSAAFSPVEKPATMVEFSAANAITLQRQRRRNREWNNRNNNRNRRWNNNRNRRWNNTRNRRWNNNRRARVVRQVYYRNGRRYVRYIRVYR